MLAPRRGESLLDVGCGTGYFTRRFARDAGVAAAGLDPDRSWLAYARAHAVAGERYLAGVAEALPFPDRSFDLSVSVTALCFAEGQREAVREMLRVTRRRIALGLLNRGSLLYRAKAGAGAYRGAHWHTPDEVRALFAGLPVRDLELRSAVLLPDGGAFARAAEKLLPQRWLRGALLAVAGDVAGPGL
jgi:SAM-dependent methyltransferase